MVVQLSDRQDCKHINKFSVDRFVFLDGPVDRNIDNLVIADADHDVALSFLKCFYTCISQTTCQNSVEGAWGTASLKVSEDSHADIVLRILFADTVCIVHGAASLGLSDTITILLFLLFLKPRLMNCSS